MCSVSVAGNAPRYRTWTRPAAWCCMILAGGLGGGGRDSKAAGVI